jgi:hypothetical protein
MLEALITGRHVNSQWNSEPDAVQTTMSSVVRCPWDAACKARKFIESDHQGLILCRVLPTMSPAIMPNMVLKWKLTASTE